MLEPNTLTLGFSPCPNDTFIFDALVNKKIDTAGLQFDVHLEDVQTLNKWAIDGKMDITKISYGVLPLVLDEYILMNSGSALGRAVGPLLIRKKGDEITTQTVDEHVIAIPGENTTAHMLFSLAYPHAKNKVFMRYDEIEDFVLAEKGLGVIIHENRFTYEEKGLKKIIDLGEHWEKITQHPIPLGGIIIRREFDRELQQRVDGLIKKSIQYAFEQYPELNDYIRDHAQEMSEDIMRKHIDHYVNDYSLDLGSEGRAAVQYLIRTWRTVNNNQRLLPGAVFLEP